MRFIILFSHSASVLTCALPFVRTHSKWHVGYVTNSYTPWMRGFDSSYGFFASGVDYNTKCSYKAAPPTDTSAYAWCRTVPHASGDGTTHHLYDWFAHNVFADDQQQPAYFSPGHPRYNTTYLTNLHTQRAIEIIQQHNTTSSSQPLFLFLAFAAVHSPLQAPNELSLYYAGAL